METINFVIETILSNKSLLYLWIGTAVYLLASLPSFFGSESENIFMAGFYLLIGVSVIYPFLSLGAASPWWYWLLFTVPMLIIFFWSFLLIRHSSDGAIALLTPFIFLLFTGIATLIIRAVKMLL